MPGGGMPGGGIPGGHPGGGSPACCMLVSWLCCTKFAQDALPTGGGGKKFGGGGRNGIPGNTDIGAGIGIIIGRDMVIWGMGGIPAPGVR